MAEGGAGAERRMAEGVEKLSEAELLAIILRVGRGTFKRGIECDRRLRYGIEEVQR